ncbi:hypothetical protein DFH07DRAFT_772347 [Mycena maculata]|uniref:Uncharacterized protein n=1 Tax=Mycena maculata TaxID=230809 RepID=A0AAD7NER1_9AGAR|nr:hypothetical protein DFH07DRAFT_772347 [Mycena maculata]
MAPSNPIWELFESDKNLYKSNRTNHGAWCKACLESSEGVLRQQEINAVARGAAPEPPKTRKEWMGAALTERKKVMAAYPGIMICGKTDTMRTHAKTCRVIQNAPERIAKRDEILIRSDAATEAAKRTRTSSNAQVSSSQHPANLNYRFPSQSPRFDNSSFPSPPSQHPPLSPLGEFNALPSFGQDGSFSPSSAFAPSPSPSIADSPSLKRCRTSYLSESAQTWTSDHTGGSDRGT